MTRRNSPNKLEKVRNPYAKSLQSKLFKQRKVPNKKKIIKPFKEQDNEHN